MGGQLLSNIKKEWWAIISAICVIVLMKPYFVWSYDVSFVRYILIIIVLFNFNMSLNNIKYWIPFAFTMMIFPMTHQVPLSTYFSYLGLSLIPFTKEKYFLAVYQWFVRIYSIIMLISMFVWVLTLLGIIRPIGIISPLNDIKVHQYYLYPFLVQPTAFSSFSSIFDLVRFCSVFDEAGVVGTISLLILFINQFNLKNKINIIVLLSGLISLSLAFYIGLIVLLLSQSLLGMHSKRDKLIIVGGFIVLVIAIFNIPILNEFIGNRLQFDFSQMKLIGDDRSNEALSAYIDQIRWTKEYWCGANSSIIHDSRFEGKWGIDMAVLQYGALYIFGYSFFFLLFACLKFQKCKYHIFLFVLMYLMIMYQRPFISYVEYIFLFASYIRINAHNVRYSLVSKQRFE